MLRWKLEARVNESVNRARGKMRWQRDIVRTLKKWFATNSTLPELEGRNGDRCNTRFGARASINEICGGAHWGPIPPASHQR